ncbi:MAG: DUF1205 domain-containing protein [Kutzneria sp.]|nr:DUF1205 domain-containing protein [Kutzneria sp.]
MLPTVSLAHAIQVAGHDVLYACGGAVDMISKAGLHVVDTAPGVDFGRIFGQFAQKLKDQSSTDMRELLKNGDEGDAVEAALRLFARVSEPTLDGTMRVAQWWRPDVVVYSPAQAAGPLVAAKLGIPAVCHDLGLSVSDPWTSHRHVVREELAEYYAKHDVADDPKTTVRISVTPPSVAGSANADAIWPMRYVPYNGGGIVPEWLVEPRQRRRIAVTLGTVVPTMAGLGILRPFLDAAGQTDAEFVLALGDVDHSVLGDLPDNVRPVGYLPLGVVLSGCDAAIHHGGAGTMMTTVAAGIPQIVVPQGADQFVNADIAQANGIGLRAEPADVDKALIERLLTDPAMRANAERFREELRTMPTPGALAQRLVELVS